jgi:DNA repair exonuclease SbcCD ATPase subunit
MAIKRIIHVSDIHIRSGDTLSSRYDEYKTQIDKFLGTVAKFEYDTTIVVVTGDLFHDKSKMGPCGQLLAQQFFRGLSRVATQSVIIRGNHDYRQDAPLEPDLIQPFFDDIPENVTYIDESGLFQFEDVEFGLVTVQDTLIKGAGAGVISNLPDFPPPTKNDPSIKHNIALFHGSFGGALLQNGSEVDGRCNYPLAWIEGYDLRLFGDIHVQQIHNAKEQKVSDLTSRTTQDTYTVSKFVLPLPSAAPWGYAGSLVQQNFGESLWGHGFIEWNLETKQATLHHVPNNFGFVIATMNQAEEPCVKVRLNNKSQLIPIKTIVTYAWFPTVISLRFSTRARQSTQQIQEAFELAGVVIKDTGFVEENAVESTDIITQSAESNETLINDLTNLNSPDTWIKFFQDDAKVEDGEWSQWVKHPHLLATPTDIFPADVKTKLDKRNVDLAKIIDKYAASRDVKSPIRHFRIHYIEFGWLLCFGAENFLNLDGFTKKVSLISGNNGSGKSSLLEILCLAIYGESFPSRYNKNFSAAIVNQHKPSGESGFTRILVSIDGKKYWINRSFDGQPANPRNLWQRTVKLIDEETTEIIKQTPSVVDAWVNNNIGRYEHFLLTTIVSQSNDSDFFAMKPQEQKAIIDSLLQLDVVEDFSKILYQAALDHKFAIGQLDTYESGRSSVTKLLNTMPAQDLDALRTSLSETKKQIQELQDTLTEAKENYSEQPVKVFQTPLYEYTNDLHQLQAALKKTPDCQQNQEELKESRQSLRDTLAILKSKRYKQQPTVTVSTATPAKPLHVLEAELDKLKMQRAVPNSMLYDSKAHDNWLLEKANWYETHEVPPEEAVTLRELLAEQATCQAGYDELKDDIDEEEHQPVTDKVLKGLEKQHTDLSTQKEELEQTKKQVYKQLQQLKVLLSPQVKEQIQTYQQVTTKLLEAFNITDNTEASPILSQLQQLNQQQSQTEKELAKVTATLDELIKIKFNPKCDACTTNPYKHKREALEQEQKDLQLNNKKTQSAISKLQPPNTTYEQLKQLHDSWLLLHNTKILAAIDNQTRCNQGLEEHKQLSQQIKELEEEIDDVGWESQTNVNEFYYNKKRLTELHLIVTHLKFTEEEKEFQAAKANHALDQQIQKLELTTAQAYYQELSQTETRLKTIEQQIDQMEQYNLTKQRISQVNQIIEAYPHFTNAQSIEAKLKPLIQAAATTEATLNQNQAISSQMAEARTFEQQIGTFRQLLEQRSQLISKLSDAYSKYTSWLYPTKVGPAIETAVNDVLNSIQLPRPISLNGEWDKDHFIWYVRDGNSRPPYEKCSGAQRFFIGLAIRIALGRLGSSNMINDQIFIDEGFTACDQETMDRVPSLLNNLLKDSNKLNAVFMVSHLEQLKTAAAASIPIVRGATSSRLHVGERLGKVTGIPLQTQDAPAVPPKKRGRPKKAAAGETLIEVST